MPPSGRDFDMIANSNRCGFNKLIVRDVELIWHTPLVPRLCLGTHWRLRSAVRAGACRRDLRRRGRASLVTRPRQSLERGVESMAISGVKAMIEMLSAAGVRYLFGNPGTTELPLMDALASDERV